MNLPDLPFNVSSTIKISLYSRHESIYRSWWVVFPTMNQFTLQKALSSFLLLSSRTCIAGTYRYRCSDLVYRYIRTIFHISHEWTNCMGPYGSGVQLIYAGQVRPLLNFLKGVGGFNPPLCLSTPKFFIEPRKNSQNKSKIHCWPPPSGFPTNWVLGRYIGPGGGPFRWLI